MLQVFRDSPEEKSKTSTISCGPNSRTRFYESYSTVRRPDRATKINVRLKIILRRRPAPDALVQWCLELKL